MFSNSDNFLLIFNELTYYTIKIFQKKSGVFAMQIIIVFLCGPWLLTNKLFHLHKPQGALKPPYKIRTNPSNYHRSWMEHSFVGPLYRQMAHSLWEETWCNHILKFVQLLLKAYYSRAVLTIFSSQTLRSPVSQNFLISNSI